MRKDKLQPISEVVFPPPVFDNAQRQKQQEVLQRTEYAQPAIGVFSAGLYKILQQAGFKPDFVAGHSFGELTALWAAEVLSDTDYLSLVKARGQAMATPNASEVDAGAMLAVKGDVSKVATLVKQYPLVTIANFNSTKQVVLAGTKAEIVRIQQVLNTHGFSTVVLPVAAAFHTPLVGYAQKPFAQAIEATSFQRAQIPVYSNVTGKVYPNEPPAMQKILKQHLLNSVLFKDEIENIYADGGYVFVEFGSRNILTNLVRETLGDRPYVAVAMNAHKQQNSDRTLRCAVVQLRVAGLSLGSLDPYQLEQKLPVKSTNDTLRVRLNSANLSEKTQAAFAQALAEDRTIATPIKPAEIPPMHNGKHTQPKDATPLIQPNVTTKPQPTASVDYQKILDSIKSTLAQFNAHHNDILHVHEQSLKHQQEYAQTFCQLTQQQNMLLANNGGAVKDSLERSMMRFHDHQAETLRIHEQYLQQQMSSAHDLFGLIEQKYESTIEKQASEEVLVSHGNGHHPIASTITPLETATLATPAAPIPTTICVPAEIDITKLSQTLLNVVSDKTGYPVEMLELSMDMEADLGIDSIKRVEILGGLLELYPDLAKPDPEALTELRTLGQISEYMSNIATQSLEETLPKFDRGEDRHSIIRSMVQLKILPLPDTLECYLPPQRVCLVTDDGSTLTSHLVQALSARGEKVVVLSFPKSVIAQHASIDDTIPRIVLEDLSEAHLQQQLNAIAQHGSIGAFIHLNPADHNQHTEIDYLNSETALLKHVFLIAKHLKQPLNQAANYGRSCFITVTHLDGELGIGQKTNYSAIAGGFFGLTKTLNQEWESVFCRALDISAEIDVNQAVQSILAEIQDPNRALSEVGYGAKGRITLVRG